MICLQGDQQGERIEQLSTGTPWTRVFARRRLRCGNPYAFQGDERDVMFMSMVVATIKRTRRSLLPCTSSASTWR